MKFKNIIKKVYKLLNFIGFDLIKFFNLFFIIKVIKNYITFKKLGGKSNKFQLILGQHKSLSGNIDKHYFNQDIRVANLIFEKKPEKHVDIGSRIDGFVSHIASFRKLEVFDIRKNIINNKNIEFKNINLQSLEKSYYNYSDSVSCLHTIEHLGLGRYGDDIDPHGYKKAFLNLINLTKQSGTLYVSFPIAKISRVEFNAHRVFNPLEIFKWSKNFDLISFDYIDDNGYLKENIDIKTENFDNLNYGCGIYTLKIIK
jgi:hypothetical protein